MLIAPKQRSTIAVTTAALRSHCARSFIKTTLERLNYRLAHSLWRWTIVVHADRARFPVIHLQRDLENTLGTIGASYAAWTEARFSLHAGDPLVCPWLVFCAQTIANNG